MAAPPNPPHLKRPPTSSPVAGPSKIRRTDQQAASSSRVKIEDAIDIEALEVRRSKIGEESLFDPRHNFDRRNVMRWKSSETRSMRRFEPHENLKTSRVRVRLLFWHMEVMAR